jgi:hypothetical protein
VALAGLCSGAYHALEAAARFEVRGVAALHADLDSGPLEYRPETFSSERRVWVYYRAWVKWLKRSRAGRAVVWRIPGPGWWALDRLRLQPDASAGVRRLVAAGTDVVLVMEEWNMATPRAWAVQHAGAHRPTIVASDAEHSLLRAVDRAAMEDLVVELARDWKQGCRARPSSLRLAIP